MTGTVPVTGVLFAVWLAAAARAFAADSGIPASEAAPAICLPPKPGPGPGLVDPFHVPAAAATQLNADGKLLYRQGRWDEARAKYRAAEAADPEFMAPAVNVACSFVRQEHYAEAVAEVLRLLDRAYLPWNEEVISAADLGAIKVRPEGKQLRAAQDAGRLNWAEGLTDDLILVARTRPPLKLGTPKDGPGVLVLGPRQEVFAWSPRTLRYRQLTSEEGRVLVVARSRDGRRIAYVTGEKLIRGPTGDVALRGLMVKEMLLGTLSPLGQGRIVGDVRRLDIMTNGTGFAYRIDQGPGSTTYRLKDGGLEADPGLRIAHPAVTLTGRGVAPLAAAVPLPGPCAGTARDFRAQNGGLTVEVRGKGKKEASAPAITVGGRFGAGLSGLPIP